MNALHYLLSRETSGFDPVPRRIVNARELADALNDGQALTPPGRFRIDLLTEVVAFDADGPLDEAQARAILAAVRAPGAVER